MSEIPGLGVVIVCGGSSRRYGKNKLFELLAGVPVFCHSLKNFSPLVEGGKLVVVVPEKEIAQFRELARLSGCRAVFTAGGENRGDSVRRGLAALPEDTRIAAIHDGARPLASGKLLRRLVETVLEKNCGVIAAEKMIDSVCRAEGEGMISGNVPREDLWRIQTPQVFWYRDIVKAYSENGCVLSDDSAVARSCGYPVMVLENPEPNMKLTLPGDLSLLEYLFQRKNALSDKG